MTRSQLTIINFAPIKVPTTSLGNSKKNSKDRIYALPKITSFLVNDLIIRVSGVATLRYITLMLIGQFVVLVDF